MGAMLQQTHLFCSSTVGLHHSRFSVFRISVILQLKSGSRAHKRERQSLQIRARPMKALSPIDVLDFDDALWVISDLFDQLNAVPAVAKEPALDRSRHMSFPRCATTSHKVGAD
jgi:hypothetical protein